MEGKKIQPDDYFFYISCSYFKYIFGFLGFENSRPVELLPFHNKYTRKPSIPTKW